MAKYKTKVSCIDAIAFTGKNFIDVRNFLSRFDISILDNGDIKITLNNNHSITIHKTDYIIQNIHGSILVTTKEEFENKYEPI